MPRKPRCVVPTKLKWEAAQVWSPTSHRALIAVDVVSTGGKSPFAVSLALGLGDEEGRVSDWFHSYVKVTASPPAGES